MSDSETTIEQALLHVEKEGGKFYVRGICHQGKGDEKKWYLFAKEDQDPNDHPLMKPQILRLKIKNFRNFSISKERLKPYLTADEKAFQFKNVPLIADSEKSITDANPVQSDDDEDEPSYKKPRTSTPKQKTQRLRATFKPKTQAKGPNFLNFLKGHEIIKKMKLKAFDPFKDNAESWISNFEKEFQLHASVEDLGFTNLLHLMDSQEGKKWHFKHRSKYTCWKDCKKQFVKDFSDFFVIKLFKLKEKFDESKEALHEFATRQINLWKRFFPNLKHEQLNTLVVSGLSKELALQMSHYVGNEEKDFINFCKWTDKWEETGMTDSDFEMDQEPKDSAHIYEDEAEEEEGVSPEESENLAAAEKERLDAEQREADKRAADKRVAAEKERLAAEQREADKRAAAEKERLAAEQQREADKRAADKRAADKRAAAEKERLAAEQRKAT